MRDRDFNALDWIAYILVLVGAINWGLIGLFSFNLVEAILGFSPAILRIVYILVGLSGIYLLYPLFFKGPERKR